MAREREKRLITSGGWEARVKRTKGKTIHTSERGRKKIYEDNFFLFFASSLERFVSCCCESRMRRRGDENKGREGKREGERERGRQGGGFVRRWSETTREDGSH